MALRGGYSFAALARRAPHREDSDDVLGFVDPVVIAAILGPGPAMVVASEDPAAASGDSMARVGGSRNLHEP